MGSIYLSPQKLYRHAMPQACHTPSAYKDTPLKQVAVPFFFWLVTKFNDSSFSFSLPWLKESRMLERMTLPSVS